MKESHISIYFWFKPEPSFPNKNKVSPSKGCSFTGLAPSIISTPNIFIFFSEQ